MLGVFRGGSVAEGDFHGLVRVGLLAKRDEGFLAVGAGVDRGAIDAGLPQRGALGQHRAEGGAAFRFHEETRVGDPLPVAGNLGGEFQEIDDLIDRLALLIPLDFRADLEIAGGVLPRGEGGRGGKQAELGGQLGGIDFQQRPLADGGGEFHLQRADDLDETALRLDVERADFAGRELAATGGHGLLEGEQHGARAEQRAGQRDDHRLALAPPITPDVLAGDIDVADRGGHGDAPLGGGRADDEIVHQHAAVGGSGFQRVEVEHIGLDGAAERLDAERERPLAFAEAEGLLQAGGLAREESDRHLGESFRARCGDETVTGGGGRADVSAPRFRAGETKRLDLPRARLRRLVFLKPHADELAVHHGLLEDDFQNAVAVLRLGSDGVIRDLGSGDGSDGVVGGREHFPLAEGCLADVQLEIGDDAAVGFREFIDRDLGDTNLRQHLIRAQAVGEIGGGETIDEDLAQRRVLAAGELVRCELDESFRVGDLDADGAVVGDAGVSAVAQGADGRDAQSLHIHGETAERGLRLDGDAGGTLDGAREFHLDLSGRAFAGNRPCQHGLAGDGKDLARACQGKGEFGQFPLEHAQV